MSKYTVEDLVVKFMKYPSYMDTGSGTISKHLGGVDVDIIKQAKAVVVDYKNKQLELAELKNHTNARILLLDIETAPIIANIWRLWKQSVNEKQILTDWFVLCYAAKWMYSDEVIGNKITPEEALRQDDSRLMEDLAELLNQADIIITYNGINFDIPKVNTRFLIHGITPPGKYLHIDLYRTIKSEFAFSSNKLAYVNEQLGLETKDESKLEWWVQAYLGNPDAINMLATYNENDVVIMEDLYLMLRPWIKSHPNLTLYAEKIESKCGVCGSKNLKPWGYSLTAVGKYPVHKCNSCGSLLRERKSVLTREENKSLLKN